jgi:hypothetical protein
MCKQGNVPDTPPPRVNSLVSSDTNLHLVRSTPPVTGDKVPCTEPEHTEFFQNTLKNVFIISQLSKL